MPKEFIVAIELGSSKMTGIAGQKNLDGSITVLATVEEDSSSCIQERCDIQYQPDMSLPDQYHQKVEGNTEARYPTGLCRCGWPFYPQHQERDRERPA